MYKLKAGVAVDIGREIEAMVRFTAERWDNVLNLKDVFERVYQIAARDARAWFDPYSVSRKLLDLAEMRGKLLEEIASGEEGMSIGLRDRVLNFALLAGCEMGNLQELAMNLEGEWDFDDNASRAYVTVLQHHESLSKARPKGWDKLAENYVDFAGTSDYDPVEGKQFEGANSSWQSSPDYPQRIALPFVMYDEFCQGNRAALVLVSAAYGHFLRVVMHVNTEALLTEMEMLEACAAERQPIYKLEIGFTHPVLKTLMEAMAYDKGMTNVSKQAYVEACLRANLSLPAGVES